MPCVTYFVQYLLGQIQNQISTAFQFSKCVMSDFFCRYKSVGPVYSTVHMFTVVYLMFMFYQYHLVVYLFVLFYRMNSKSPITLGCLAAPPVVQQVIQLVTGHYFISSLLPYWQLSPITTPTASVGEGLELSIVS